MELELREVAVETLVKLRDEALSPGHPNRPVIWPYDYSPGALHLAALLDSSLAACVSLDPVSAPSLQAPVAYRFHSMAVQPSLQRRGIGTALLEALILRAKSEGVECLWATARLSALPFYEKMGFVVAVDEQTVEETNFKVKVVTLNL